MAIVELSRIASHLFWLATHALDIGAQTMLFWCTREREVILDFFEAALGDRLTTSAFKPGGLRRDLPEGHWDVIVLSNILEHIEDRVGLLTDIVRQADPDQFLIRVPHFERDWSMAMRKEVGANYFRPLWP